jgi:hypothetical protein
MTLYFAIGAVETFLLGIYLVLVGSENSEQLLLSLSVSRLVISLVIFAAGIVFTGLAVRAFTSHRKGDGFLNAILESREKLWVVFYGSLVFAGLMVFSLTRQLNAYGDFKLIYQRLEPVIVWAALLFFQTAMFTLIWYSAYFVNTKEGTSINQVKQELAPVFGIFFVIVLFKLLLVTSAAYGPTGRGDEMTYFDMADSFYRGFFSVAQTHHYPPLYPLALVPALVFRGWAFAGIKLINVLLSTSIVFPVYLASRSFLNHRKSLMAAFLSCLIPYHLVFPRRIVSENLFFPLFMWGMYVTYARRGNKTSRLFWDILNGILIGMMFLTRYITIATIPFFMAAWWIKPFERKDKLFKPGWKKILHFAILAAVMLATFSPWIIGGIREGVPVKLVLGFGVASRTTEAQLTFTNLLIWVLLYTFYYILIAAPVLPLLLLSFGTIDFKKWREGLGCWIFQVLALMAGFYAAVTRHSWRAYYNRDMPSAIMGRYLIFYSVPFIIIALTSLDRFEFEKDKRRKYFLPFLFLTSFFLVAFSYMALVRGAVVQTDGNLLKSHGSVDVFFIDVLGNYFFVLVAAIYGISVFFLQTNRKRMAVTCLVFSLIVYYTAGWPGYYKNLMEYQTYPWLASKIAALAPTPDLKSGAAEMITVYVPADMDTRQRAEIYNGLRVRSVDNTIIEYYSADAAENMQTAVGFIINREIDAEPLTETTRYQYSFNGEQFIIESIGE